MRTVRIVATCTALCLGTATLAAAQETGKTGVTMAYPGSIGVIWHASDTVAIRPAFSFNHTSGESSIGSDNHSWGLGFGLGALFYLRKYDSVRTYVSPQFSYSRTNITATPVSTSGTLPEIASHNDATGGAGTFGAQFFATPHFSVYGEAGIAFTHHKTATGSSTAVKGSTWGTVAGVGVVMYL